MGDVAVMRSPVFDMAGRALSEASYVTANDIINDNQHQHQVEECEVCFDDEAGLVTLTPAGCGHRVCRGCVERWAETCTGNRAIEEGAIACPADTACPGRFSAATLLDERTGLLRGHLRERYLQRSCEAAVAGLVAATKERLAVCPHVNCGASFIIAGPTTATGCAMACPECRREFCLSCRAVHVAGARDCAAHRATLANDLSARFVGRFTQPCPGCQVPIIKRGGCNSVYCTACKGQFCWACLQPFAPGINHNTCYRDMQTKERQADTEAVRFARDVDKVIVTDGAAAAAATTPDPGPAGVVLSAEDRARATERFVRSRKLSHIADPLVGELDALFS